MTQSDWGPDTVSVQESESPVRIAPANVEAEQCLLGAIFRNNGAHSRVADFLLPEHFSYEVHGRIYAAICGTIDKGTVANPATLKNLFDQDGTLASIGGSAYLVKLATAAGLPANAEDYGRVIHDLYLRRALIDIGETVMEGAYDHKIDNPATGQIELAEQKLFELATSGRVSAGFRDFDSTLEESIQQAEARFKRGGRITDVVAALDKHGIPHLRITT